MLLILLLIPLFWLAVTMIIVAACRAAARADARQLELQRGLWVTMGQPGSRRSRAARMRQPGSCRSRAATSAR
jgi:hypothetical protein